jgi:hypothetical protein
MAFVIEVTAARFVCDFCGDAIEYSGGPDPKALATAAAMEHVRLKHPNR